MKLRNKKTGEIAEVSSCNSASGKIRIHYRKEDWQIGTSDSFSSLAELNEEWEDYKPAEPLIKDEKTRKAVRAWAEANSLKSVAFENHDDENVCFIDRDYEPQIWFPRKSVLINTLDDGKIYTITELCGEEED